MTTFGILAHWSKTTALLAIASGTILSQPIQALPAATVAQKIDCKNAQTTVEIRYCANQTFEAADKRLNQVYRKLLSTQQGANRTKLIRAEEAWIKYRDTNCDVEVRQWVGGTGYPAALLGCLERVTKQRTAELESQMQQR